MGGNLVVWHLARHGDVREGLKLALQWGGHAADQQGAHACLLQPFKDGEKVLQPHHVAQVHHVKFCCVPGWWAVSESG